MGSRRWRRCAPAWLAVMLAGGPGLSCGGGSDGGGKSPAFTLTSADGVLTLSLPEGALPAGVTQAEVKITPVAPAGLPTVNGTPADRAWVLAPDGLVLATPATMVLAPLTAELGDSVVLVLHQSGSPAAPRLEVVALEVSDATMGDRAHLQGPLGHFSKVVWVHSTIGMTGTGSAVFDQPEPAPPPQVFVDQPFRIETRMVPRVPGSVRYGDSSLAVLPTTLDWGEGSLWSVKSVMKPSSTLDPSAAIHNQVSDAVAPSEVSFDRVFKCREVGPYSLSRTFEVDVETEKGVIVRASSTNFGMARKGGTCVMPGADPGGDAVDSVSTNVVRVARPAADLIALGARRETMTAAEVATTYNNSIYGCSVDTADMKVVCPASVQPMPAGDVLTFFLRVNAAIPRADGATSYIYSVVLDSDGAAPNNWRFVAPFDWDYFQGTDRWYQLAWNHTTRAWSLTATQVDASQQTTVVSTTARAVLSGDSVVFHISASELAAATGYRLSAFGHDGNFTQATRGGDVTGANPTEALLPMPQ